MRIQEKIIQKKNKKKQFNSLEKRRNEKIENTYYNLS